MKVLVTGANGYLGQGIVKQLLDDGIEVVAADVSVENIDKRATLCACNLFSQEITFDFLGQPDVLLHLAWRNGFVHKHVSHIEDIPKHFAFLQKMIEGGIKRIAVMGTMHEVGFYEGCIKEDTPTQPMSYYGVGKDCLRKLAQLMCNEAKIAFQWLRGYYIVGNTEFGNSIFSKITASEKAGQAFFPFTTGMNQYDFISYEDFCKQTAFAVEQDEVLGIINICSGRPEKLSVRVENYIRENGYNIKLDYGKYPDRPYDAKAVWGDDAKICRIMKERNMR